MRRRVRVTTFVLALVFAVSLLVAAACVMGLVARRSGVVLLTRSTAGGRAYFLVADHDSFRVARQQMAATGPGIAVDARRLDTFIVNASQASAPVVISSGQNQIQVSGRIEMKFSSVPLTRGRLGLRWGSYGLPGGAVKGFAFTALSENVVLSYWTVLAVDVVSMGFTAMPLARRRRRQRRIAARLCALCGYDLRASPERCPECGTPTPAAIVVA